jgi:hypothetical protein
MKMMKNPVLLISVVFIAALAANAQCTGSSPTWTSSPDQTSVAACIAIAVSGDTINVGSGSVTWSALSIPSSKGITLSGGHGGTTTINGDNALVINTNANSSTRVTGFTFTGPGQNSATGNVKVSGASNNAPFRIDNNIFTSGTNATFIVPSDNNPGLIDHNSFSCSQGEMIHVWGVGSGSSAGWVDDVTPGDWHTIVFLEDNTFTNTNSTYIASAIQEYYGARYVARHNTVTWAQFDVHGTSGMVNGRWFEMYNNTFIPAGHSVPTYIRIRGGSGIIFGNSEDTSQGGNTGSGGIELTNDDTSSQCGSWPCAWQTGAGHGDISNGYSSCGRNTSPVYLWGSFDTGRAYSSASTVQVNRDYFLSSTQPSSLYRGEMSTDGCSTTYAYTPFTYPYPLNANGMPTPTSTPKPAAPSNLSAVAQ